MQASGQLDHRSQQYRSCQWLGPVSVRPVAWSGLGLKIGCACKIPNRKKSSDYLANSRKAQQQFLALLKSRGATENLSQARPPYQWRQLHSMLQILGKTAVLSVYNDAHVLIQPKGGKMLREHPEIFGQFGRPCLI